MDCNGPEAINLERYAVAIDRAADIAKRSGIDLSQKDKRRDGGSCRYATTESDAPLTASCDRRHDNATWQQQEQ